MLFKGARGLIYVTVCVTLKSVLARDQIVQLSHKTPILAHMLFLQVKTALKPACVCALLQRFNQGDLALDIHCALERYVPLLGLELVSASTTNRDSRGVVTTCAVHFVKALSPCQRLLLSVGAQLRLEKGKFLLGFLLLSQCNLFNDSFLFSLGKHIFFFVGALRCEHFWLDLKVLLPLLQLRGRSPFLKAKHFVESILLLSRNELSALLAPHVLVSQYFALDGSIQAEKVSLFALVILKIALCEDFLVASFATQIKALAQLSDALSVPDLKFVEALSLFDRLEVQVSLKVKIMIL